MRWLQTRLTHTATRLWEASAPLTVVGVLMLAALAGSLAGLWLDPRSVTGAPAWLKPAKFAVSTAIYAFTLAWMFTFLPAWRRTKLIVGWSTAIIFVVEVAIIDMQAWRGMASHFNVATPLDVALFGIMGSAILIQTLASVSVAVALWRQVFRDAALGWALRLGVTMTIAGALSGGLMTRPTAAQLADAHATHRMRVSGAHTVGAPDGGPGLPGTGWSVTHGDLRVPHFVGLHAMQVMPLIALAVGRRRAERQRLRLTFVAAASYASLFVGLLWQALRGQSLLQPDAMATGAFVFWAVATAAAWIAASRGTSVAARAAIA